jgi:hypothetical protein
MTIEQDDSSSRRLEEMYRPPTADEVPLPEPPQDPLLEAEFYVVSRTKFLVLFFATFGAYQLYWFFTNWRRYRSRTGTSLSPFWRAVFSLFFVHRLFGLLAEGGARGAPTAPRLEAKGMATLYVALVIGSWLIDRLGDNVVLDSAATALGLCAAYPLLAAQHAANAASGDPSGAANSRMSGLNYVFIAFGLVLWPFFILGLVMVHAGE